MRTVAWEFRRFGNYPADDSVVSTPDVSPRDQSPSPSPPQARVRALGFRDFRCIEAAGNPIARTTMEP
jgi:hypothetical protein